MIIILSKKKVKLIDSMIKIYAEANGGYLKESNVMMRAVWNIFTNNNGERKRSLSTMVDAIRNILKKKKK